MTRAMAEARAREASEALGALSLEAWDEACEAAGLPDPFVWSRVPVPQLLAFSAACRIRLAEAGVLP